MRFSTGTRFGPYQLVAALGAGGMGEVYRALDTRLKREVALKVLRGAGGSDIEARRFLNEAVVLARLSHPNIATLHEFDHVEGVDFLVLELVAGETLAARLKRGALAEAEAVDIAEQVAAALEHAHGQGVVHQDLKPVNLIVTPEGRIKVLDFGIARVFSWSPDAATLLATNRGAGTLHYMAPEQLRGEDGTTHTDIYGLGVVLYEMLTGERPFDASTSAMVSNAILHDAPKPPSARRGAISPALDQIVLQCLAKQAGARFATATALREALLRTHSEGTAVSVGGLRPLTAGRMAPPLRSLAALPAEVLGPETDRYLADAVASTLSTCLGREPGLQIKLSPRQADVERVEGGLSAVMQAYAVDIFLMASVIPMGTTLAVNLQAVAKNSQEVLWSQDLETERAGLLGALRGAARGLAENLGAARTATMLSAEPQHSPETELPLQNALYRANYYMQRGHAPDFEAARASLEALASSGVRVAEAAAALARMYASALQRGMPVAEALPQVRRWAECALAADPRSGRAWAALSTIEGMAAQGFGRQLEYGLRAATLAPEDPAAHLALSAALFHSSHVFTLAACRHAGRLDPLDVYAAVHEATLLGMQGRHAEALPRIEHALTIGPDYPVAVIGKAGVLCVTGEFAAASVWIEDRLQKLAEQRRILPEWVTYFRRVAALGMATDPEAAGAARDGVMAMATGAQPFNYWQMLTQGAAPMLAQTGHIEAALAVLERRVEAGILDPYDFFLTNRRFEPLRRQSRFQAVAAHSRGSFLATLSTLGRARNAGEFPDYLAEPWSRYAGLAEVHGEAVTEAGA